MTDADISRYVAYFGAFALGVALMILWLGVHAHSSSANSKICKPMFKAAGWSSLVAVFFLALAAYYLPRTNYYPENVGFDQSGNVVSEVIGAPVPNNMVYVTAMSVLAACVGLLLLWLTWSVISRTYIQRYFDNGELTHNGQIDCNKYFGNQPEKMAAFFWGAAFTPLLPPGGDPKEVAEVIRKKSEPEPEPKKPRYQPPKFDEFGSDT